MQPRQAAMLPLDYGDPKRDEFSVVFSSTNWEELVPLLADPCEYLSAVSNTWGQVFDKPHKRVKWNLHSQPTVLVEWLGGSVEGIMKTLALQGAKGKEALEDLNGLIEPLLQFNHPDRLREEVATRTHPGASVDVVLFELMLLVQQGIEMAAACVLEKVCQPEVFFAEFAVETNTLTVSYHKTNVCAHRYCGEMPKAATFAKLGDGSGTAKGTQRASLHFDIGKDERDRACFVVDYLSDCSATLGNCLGLKKSESGVLEPPAGGKAKAHCMVGTTEYAQEGRPLNIRKPKEDCFPTIKNQSKYPRVVMETHPSQKTSRLDGSNDCQICIVVDGILTDPTTYVTGTTTAKCYVAPPPG